jgi:DMSO/TMAO reductase YedYZ molybdopterin-dependent catalytic subunit
VNLSFLGSLINDRFYQRHEPRKPEEIDDAEVIISPDTRRANRMPPGQSRTRKFPVLDAHGAPEIDLEKWQFKVGGLVENELSWSLDDL